MEHNSSLKKDSKIEKTMYGVVSLVVGVGLGCLANLLPLVGEPGELTLVNKLGATAVGSVIWAGLAMKNYYSVLEDRREESIQILKNTPIAGIGTYIGLELMNYIIN